MTKTVDPFAGSYAVESMTDEIEAAALELIQAVEDKGGAVAAIEQGFQKTEIERSAYRIALEIDSRERTVVGVNRFRARPGGALRAAARRPADRDATSGPASRPCAPTATTTPSQQRPATRSETRRAAPTTCSTR